MDTHAIRQSLHNEEQRLEDLRSTIQEGTELDLDEQHDSGGELSVVDQHPADIATEQQQREIDLTLLEQVEAELSDVEHALRRLDDGTYGTCEACGQPIGEERLSAMPIARFCVADQAQAELGNRRTTIEP